MGSNALHDLAAEAGTLITIGHYSATAVYTIHVYEWMFTIQDELTLRSWTSVKAAYLICRYYPLIIFPFHMWAWIGTHDFKTCSRIVHALYTLILPCPLSCQAVILIRAYAFTGRKNITFWALLTGFVGLTAGNVYVFGTQFVGSDLNMLLGPIRSARCFHVGFLGHESRTFSLLSNTQYARLIRQDLFATRCCGFCYHLCSEPASGGTVSPVSQ
ncbi:hypothetical protein PILCRDRAFT_294315 [Piloderma croceum F 1598]|uniref:DUF6533 domain-containing protein n=1 Tax=Piloderma croceum (strain F 1598) TaxID=765440 RepID=A0A0C3FS90_PILCF|nr:hypothetical protein PILCRDRAFT_294315 [Piloderma croceum F 1598]